MDKVQKIREEVEKRYEYWKEKESNSHSIESEIRMSECQHLLLMLDYMQEEPKFKTGDRIKPIDSCLGSPRTIVDICDSWYVTDQGTLDFEYEDNWELTEEPVSDKFAFKAIPRLLEMIEPTDRAKAYIAKLADALEVEGYPTDAKIVRESLKIMNGEKVPMATMDEEPVSEELGGYINELSKQFPEVSFAKLSRIAVRVANWQKEQFEKNRLAHCDELTAEQAQIESDFVIEHLKENSRTPTFIDAIKYGMRLQKKQMINDAYEREVKVDAGGYPYIPQMELYDYDKDIPLAKEGEKYKVVLIKED